MYIYIYIKDRQCIASVTLPGLCVLSSHLTSAGFEHCLCYESPVTSTWAHNVKVNIQHVPKYMSSHKVIVMITRRAHCSCMYAFFVLRFICICEF